APQTGSIPTLTSSLRQLPPLQPPYDCAYECPAWPGAKVLTEQRGSGQALALVVFKVEWRPVKAGLRLRRSYWWEGINCGVGEDLDGSSALALDEFWVAGRAEADCIGLLEDGINGAVGAGLDGGAIPITAIGATKAFMKSISVELDRIKLFFTGLL
ncbi:hypothetical protein V496_01950, partial [Pseudogymnoascus sp. VKM F-4515 (FW-2607)]